MYSIMRIVLAVILGMWMLMFQYLFPYIARFENGIFATLRNALLLAAAHIPSTIVIVGLSAVSYTHLDVYKRQEDGRRTCSKSRIYVLRNGRSGI